jgi:hypothetical protein
MLFRSKILYSLIGGLWMASTGRGEALSEGQYVQSGVIPLPPRPPAELKELVAVLEPYSRLNSRFVDAQIAGWLRLLNVEQLKALRAAIPGPWQYPGRDVPSDFCGLREMLPEVIASHPDTKPASNDALTAVEAGRRAGKDWKTGIETAKAIEAPAIRAQFLLGLSQSAEDASTYPESMEIRSASIALLPDSERANFSSYEQDKRAMLWPAESIARWVMRQPEDHRFGPLRFILDHGADYFANVSEATRFLAYFGRDARGQATLVDESMGSVFAARDPKGFLAWWKSIPPERQRIAISHAIVPLLRHDVTLINAVIPRLKIKSLVDMTEVTRLWFEYDPVAALAYCSKLPDFDKRASWWVGTQGLRKQIEPAVFVDLMNRYPGIWSYPLYPIQLFHFDPRHQRAEVTAGALLSIRDAKIRELALVSFGMDWGYHDGPAALAWARDVPQASDRSNWLLGVASGWIAKSPDDAAKALDGMADLTEAVRTRLKSEADARRANRAHPQTTAPPSHFAGLSFKETLPLSSGGPADTETLKGMRDSLASLAHPAEPPTSNLSLCVQVLALGEKTVVALLRELEAHPPTDARENAVRSLLLERWALSAPEPATRWMLQRGSGSTRQPLPLALSKIALVNSGLAATLVEEIPEEALHRTAMESIVYALATRDHREACEFSERHGHPFDVISSDWRRADPSAAESWLKVRWLDREF